MEFGQHKNKPAPVLTLTILDGATLIDHQLQATTRVLNVVRDPSTNTTHPNVVSTPTQRIPLSVYQQILELTHSGSSYPTPHLDTKENRPDHTTSGHNPLIYITEALLARKLGLAPFLERDQVQYQVHFGLSKTATTYIEDENSEPAPYHISMLNLVVVIQNGVDLFPDKTASYSHILWVESGKFLDMVQHKDPTRISADLNPYEYCVHGLCIATTHEILQQLMGLEQAE